MELRDFLARLRGVTGPRGKGEYMAKCPAHDDKAASLCIREGDKGIVLKCQAHCPTQSVLDAMGLTMRDLFKEPYAKGGKPGGSAARNGAVQSGGSASGGSAASGGKRERGKFVCAYRYTDEAGKLIFEACRYQREDGTKTFLLRQPDASQPGGYRWTKEGARLVLYRLPEVCAAIRDNKPVFVVEGEKDCDNLAALGIAATTNPMGAGKWAAGDYTPSLAGADVVIVPDNDDVGREHAQAVAQAVHKVARRVRVLDLRAACPELPPKGDLSDMLALMGSVKALSALTALADGAEDYTGSATSARDEAAEYYGRIIGYCVDNGRICQETQDGPKPLANFVAVPRRVVMRDDGVNVTKEMVIDGWSANGSPLSRVYVKASQFNGMGWVTENWDFAAGIMPGNTTKDKLRYAIGEVGRMTAERLTEYSHTGWRKIGGKWAYLYQGGAIGAEGVTVDLGSGLSAYRLDGSGADGFDGIDKMEAAQTSLGLREVIAEHISIPLLGTLYLAPLREFLTATGIAPAYALFVLGGTGTRKSTALALGLSHFGNFTGKSLPASFNDTANYIRKKAFLLKDAPIVVDDYHPVTSMQERKKMEATAQSLARAFGDGAERGRMKSDLSLQEAMPPRGVAIISGEDTPSVGESGMARFFVVSAGKDDVPATEMLTYMQEMARRGYLQKAMRTYIAWLIKQADELPKMLHDDFIAYRAKALEQAKGQHGRAAEAIAHIMLGYSSMLRYMRDVGAITTEDAKVQMLHAWEVVTQSSAKQAVENREERPTRMYLNAISELLTSKSAGVRDLTAEGVTGTGAREMIGYMDADYYYLMPNVAYRAVSKLYADQGQAFPLTGKMLNKQMREDGVLRAETMTSTSATRPKWIDGKSQRLLWIPRHYIDGPHAAAEQQRMQISGMTRVESDEDMPF